MVHEAAEVQLERVEDLWFPDANFIFRAENKLFRVYSHILGSRSSVFRDMATFPQPATPEGDPIDGIPVVGLHDPAVDVEVFLRAIFDSSFFMPPPSATDFATVIGIMRLAHKYDVQYLFRRALSHLESMYPYDGNEYLTFRLGTAICNVDFSSGISTDFITLRAASEVGALWILPAVYSAVCEYNSKEFFAAEGPWNALSTHQQQTCLKSQVDCVRATTLTHTFVSKLPVQSCTGHCEDVVCEAQGVLLRWSTTAGDLDPLGPWVFSGVTDNELCPECDSYGRTKYKAAQLAYWSRLPEVFDLPSWKELKEMRRAVMEDWT